MSARLNKRLRSSAWAACLGVAMACMVTPGDSQADDPPGAQQAVVPATYIGEITGAPDSARIAFVVEGDKFVAYVCSGDKEFNNTFSRWLRGDVKGGKLTATRDDVDLTASLTDDAVVGTIRKGKSHEFTAKVVAGNGSAGLFRAADKLGDDDVVFGWIMDEKGEVVGTAGKQKGAVTTLQAPKGVDGKNIAGKLKGQNGQPDRVIPAGKVGGAANNPKASPPGRKFDAAAQAAFLKNLVEQRKAEGGNALQAMVIHQVRRFVAGRKAETKLEEKVFAALRAAPKGTLERYISDWDRLPVATRDALLGPAAKQLDTNKALDAAQSRKMIEGMPKLAKVKFGAGRPKAEPGTITSVGIKTVRCNSETLPKAFGQDEVFAIHAVFVGTSGPVFKQTKLLREFDDGVTQAFPAADKGVFPLAGLAPAPGAEVTVITNLFEDDGAVLLNVLNALKPLIESVAFIVLEQFAESKDVALDEAGKEALKVGITGVIDGAIGTLGNLLTQPLGSDAIVIRPSGIVVGTSGGGKSKMVFRRLSNVGGFVLNDYELSGFEVQK